MLPRPLSRLLIGVFLWWGTCSLWAVEPAANNTHALREIEGWQVHVDRQLLEGEHQELGQTALRLLEGKLLELRLRLPASRVEKLRQVSIWLDREHQLTSMQYHPSASWLREHGYDPQMEKCVHIPRAGQFIEHIARHTQPAVVVHELAHAYHDQFLGWEHPGIVAAYEQVRAGGALESVLHISGRQQQHYALTNPKEFFAEMTESFLSTNDFYPFVRGELRDAFPEVDALLKAIWLED